MSPRNFSRVDAATTGRTPGRAMELSRIEAARRLLQSTTAVIDAFARRTGFGKGLRPSLPLPRPLLGSVHRHQFAGCGNQREIGEATCAPCCGPVEPKNGN